jgi:hypothetical protein
MQSRRLTWPIEAFAANVSNSADASNANWADMADAKESNDGKFDFWQTTALSSSVAFSLFAFSQSHSQNIAKPLLK